MPHNSYQDHNTYKERQRSPKQKSPKRRSSRSPRRNDDSSAQQKRREARNKTEQLRQCKVAAGSEMMQLNHPISTVLTAALGSRVATVMLQGRNDTTGRAETMEGDGNPCRRHLEALLQSNAIGGGVSEAIDKLSKCVKDNQYFFREN